MADQHYRVKHASVFVNGAKVGRARTSSLRLVSGDTEQTGDPGLIGWADGDARTSCQIIEFVPIQGTTFDFPTAIATHQTLSITFALLDGQGWETDMRT